MTGLIGSWEVGSVIIMLSGEHRIKTKDPSLLVLNGDLLKEKFYKYDQCGGEFRKKIKLNSKPTIMCYIHSQPYTNHLNKSLNYNSFQMYISLDFCKAFDIPTFLVFIDLSLVLK